MGAQVEAFAFDPDVIEEQESTNKNIDNYEDTEPQTAQQLYPDIYTLLKSESSEGSDDTRRRQGLARFVQTVEPAIQQIHISIDALPSMEALSEEQKEAFIKLAVKIIAALQMLKIRLYQKTLA